MQIDLPNLKYQRFQFVLEAVTELLLPEYKGSTLRGGFGHSFREIVCTMRPIPCSTCLLQQKCPYPQLFETPINGAEPVFMKGVNTGPQPFILEPTLETKQLYHSGDKVEFVLVLLGKAIEYLPYFVYTFDRLGSRGIGKGRGKFTLQEVSVWQEHWQPIYNSKSKVLQKFTTPESGLPEPKAVQSLDKISLQFVTPSRIKSAGKLVSEIAFREIVNSLFRRVYTLAFFHMPAAQVNWDWRPHLTAANDISVGQSNLEWKDWERYSNRQNTKMKMGGFIGEITFEGALTPWLPLLRLGEVTHIGKGATFGLGKYIIKI